MKCTNWCWKCSIVRATAVESDQVPLLGCLETDKSTGTDSPAPVSQIPVSHLVTGDNSTGTRHRRTRCASRMRLRQAAPTNAQGAPGLIDVHWEALRDPSVRLSTSRGASDPADRLRLAVRGTSPGHESASLAGGSRFHLPLQPDRPQPQCAEVSRSVVQLRSCSELDVRFGRWFRQTAPPVPGERAHQIRSAR